MLAVLNNKNRLQSGGANIPIAHCDTQSWLYMPLILSPFEDVDVEFPADFDNYLREKNSDMELAVAYRAVYDDVRMDLFDLASVSRLIREYYVRQGIHTNTKQNLTNLTLSNGVRIAYDSINHIPGDLQELLCADILVYLNEIVSFCVMNIIDRFPGREFKFENSNSWMFMPLILLPFTDVNIDFHDLPINQQLNDISHQLYYGGIHLPTPMRNVDEVKNYLFAKYTERGIDLANRRTLVRFSDPNLEYIDDPTYLRLREASQINILNTLSPNILRFFSDVAHALSISHPVRNYSIINIL